jgi:hypothetical protein
VFDHPVETTVGTVNLSIRSDSPEQHEDYDDNQNGAQYADTAMAKAIAVAAKAPAEATQQEHNENDDKNETERHDPISWCVTIQQSRNTW